MTNLKIITSQEFGTKRKTTKDVAEIKQRLGGKND